MAMSKCASCGNSSFEVQENTPAHSNYKLIFVQCAKCGAVVGVQDYYNIGNETYKIREALKKIAGRVGVSVDL